MIAVGYARERRAGPLLTLVQHRCGTRFSPWHYRGEPRRRALSERARGARYLRIRLSRVDDVDAFVGAVAPQLLRAPGVIIDENARAALQEFAAGQ